jgi:hypothetical protein
MPFATKFRAMMGFPFAGDTLGDLIVERVDVRDEPSACPGVHAYVAEMILSGPGGQKGVRDALKPLLARHPFTFSGYGNPYHLWFGKPEIESLGDRRYAVRVQGAGARIPMEEELARLLEHLCGEGLLALDEAARDELVQRYLADYQAEIRRAVSRYRSRLRRSKG